MGQKYIIEKLNLTTKLFFFLQQYIKFYLIGTCSELPPGSNVKTASDSVFPVKQGTEVVVVCVEGHTLAYGDTVITCVQDAEYKVWGREPSCTIGWYSYCTALFILQCKVTVGFPIFGSPLISCYEPGQ